MRKWVRPNTSDIAIQIICIVFFAGTLTFLHSCAPLEDGRWMTCHWANQALIGISAVCLVLALLRLFTEHKAKIGLDLATAAIGVLSILIPGNLISLCMMPEMRCRSIMKPGAVALSILLIACAVWDLIVRLRKQTDAQI